jgi:hypothetical protein
MPSHMLAKTRSPDPSPEKLPRPVHLTEAQAAAVFAAAHPLSADRRSDFLTAVVHALASLPEIGDGSAYRIIAEMQKKFFDPPVERAGGFHGGKHSR